jgi:hypothetical protein
MKTDLYAGRGQLTSRQLAGSQLAGSQLTGG